MALHHKIKPHHHVTMWLAALLLVAGSVIAHNSVQIDRIQAQGSEPSASTQRFFGFDEDDGSGDQFVEPEACRVDPNEAAISALDAQILDVQNQMDAIYPPDGSTPVVEDEAQQTANEAQFVALEAQMNDLQAQLEALVTADRGPSDECKIAIVQQSITQMEQMLAEMQEGDKLNSTLDRVDGVVAQIEALIPTLEESGVSAADVAQIRTSLENIQTNSTLLRSFFARMLTGMADFITTARANPLAAFADMESGGGFISDSESTAAANAADGMVNTFTDLVTLLDNIIATQGDQE